MKPQYLQQNYGGDIIELSSALLKEFADATKAPEAKKEDKYVYGTIKNNGESSYVMFDGSDFLTPITSAMGYEDGDRVMVLVKNHKAIVVNNMTSPGVTDKYVKENFASFDNLAATNAQIGYLRANMITSDVLEAKIGEFGYLKASQAEIKYASIEALNAANVEISDLKSSTIKTTELSAEVAKLGYAKITDLNVINGRIDTLESSMITTDNLKAEVADLGLMTANQADIRYLTASSAKLQFADINLANVESASIGTMLAGVGLITDATIQNGHVTGYLDSVEVNANSITAGTLAVDRLIIRGSEKSLVYELNNISGALQSKSADTLNGEILTPRTITADKLVAKSITANEIAAGTITANEIAAGTITASQINMTNLVGNSAFINAISSNSVVVGLRTDLDGISVGGRNLVRNTANGFTLPADSSNWNYYQFAVTTSPLEVAVSYTVSFNVSFISGSDSKITVALFNDNLSLCKARVDCPVSSGRVECVLAPVSEGATKLLIYAGLVGTTVNKGIRITNLKLEKGNKPTDWTPALEDVDSSISTVKSLADAAQSTANSAVSTIGKWCYNNDITYINGGKIYTGTVTADKLAANSVTAEKINVSSLSAISANIGTVTAGVIRSTNYVKDTSGMQLDLSNGSWDSKYLQINNDGKMVLKSYGKYAEDHQNANFIIKGATDDSISVLESYGLTIKCDTCAVHITPDSIDIGTISNGLFQYAATLMGHQYGPYGRFTLYDTNGAETIDMASEAGNIKANGDVTTASGASLNTLNTTVSSLNSSTYKNSGGLFNTATALLINGNALNSQWAQMAIEYNGFYFGIRNDGGSAYLMPGNSSGWYANYITIDSGGNVSMRGDLKLILRATASTTAKPNTYIATNGSIYKSSTTSSMRFKKDIQDVKNEDLKPQHLYDVDIVQFKYKDDHFTNEEDVRYQKDMIGFIAEDMYKKYPIAVDYHFDEDGNIICDGWNEQYLIPAMLKLIQDQHKRLLELEKGIQNG